MKKDVSSELILLLAAIIWGFAFVAQRIGMDYVGPFTYNGVRFALGTLVVMPILFIRIRKKRELIHTGLSIPQWKIVAGSIVTGVLLFGGVAFQQVGLQYTTAGKAGFITGLYVVLVPICGLLIGRRMRWPMWAGAILSLIGLYFLSITGTLAIGRGDLLVLFCAIIFTFHVLFIAWLSPLMDSYALAVIQFSVCTVLNLIVAFVTEPVLIETILQAWIPIAYGGVLSVGIAYTLQVVAQKTAHPAYASIILSLEAVFAVIGGWMILHEALTQRMILGCGLMLSGMVMAQINTVKREMVR
ncbi:MAG: DMT family transporter [Bacteroidales bacterium]|nr:DMT family transporter [Bacteroidales bacterium]